MPKDKVKTSPGYSGASGALDSLAFSFLHCPNLFLGHQQVSRMGSERLPPPRPSSLHGLGSLR